MYLRKNVPPRNTPDSFCRRFTPTKFFACTAWTVFFFSGLDPASLLWYDTANIVKFIYLYYLLTLGEATTLPQPCGKPVFSLYTHLENFMSRPNVIPAFQPTPLQNRGRNFVRVNRRFYIRAVTLYLFLRLNKSETTVRNVF